MILHETVCRGNHKNAWGVFGLFMGLSLLAFVAMQLEIGRPIIAQLVLLFSLLVAAYIQIRFITTAFLYQVIREEDGDYLLISRRQGRRTVAAVKLSLAHLKWIEQVDTRKSPAPIVEGVPTSNYSAYLLADAYTLVFFDDGEGRVLLRINADEPFLAALATYCLSEEEQDTDEK